MFFCKQGENPPLVTSLQREGCERQTAQEQNPHAPNLLPIHAEELGVLPRRRSLGDEQPHASASDTVRKLLLDDTAAQEVKRLTPTLCCERGECAARTAAECLRLAHPLSMPGPPRWG